MPDSAISITACNDFILPNHCFPAHQVVVADFEERQRPQDEDGQERSRDNAHHCTRNAICNLL
jgi:hypothetical protein